MLRFRLMEEEGDGAGGGAGDQGADTGLLAGAQQQQTQDTQQQQQTGPQRPEFLPENFWDADKGEPRLESLAKSQGDLRRMLNEKYGEDFVKKMTEIPADAGAYKLGELPQGFEVADDDPLILGSRESAKKHGLTQSQYEAFMGDMINILAEHGGPTEMSDEEKNALIAEQKAILGKNADQLINDVLGWGKGLLDRGVWSKEEYDEVIGMGMSAVGVRALAKMKQHYLGGSIVPPNADANLMPSKEEVYAKVADPRYYSDAGFRAQVEEEFRQIFGEEPASTSEQSLGVGNNGVRR